MRGRAAVFLALLAPTVVAQTPADAYWRALEEFLR